MKIQASFLPALLLLLACACGEPALEPQNIPVTSVSVSPSSLEMTVGGTATLKATVSPSDATEKNITWKSSDAAVVAVSGNGELSAKSAGTATVTATAGGKSGSSTVTVIQETIPVSSVQVTPSQLDIFIGEEKTLSVKVLPDNATDKTVTWTSSDPSVATVSEGTVKGLKEGTATVTASSGGKKAECRVTVSRKEIPVEAVSLDKDELSLFVGDSRTLTATVSPADATDKTVTWESSDPSVATVDDGTVNGLKEGTAVVSASAGGKKAECRVTVSLKEIPVEGISLDKEELALFVGDTYTLTATVSPADATDKTVTWSSSAPAVATVQGGAVQAVGKGEASVTASASNGMSVSCRIIVSERSEAVDMGLSVKWANMNLGASDSSEGGSFYAWGELAPKSDYSWRTYKYASGSIDSINKYGDVTDSYVLADMDDAAHSEKGGAWRIPTKHEFKELLDNCDITWSDAPAGYRFTSKINGNTLFFPASGYMEGANLQSGPFCVARYWTASTGSYDGEAAYVGFYDPSRESFDVPPSLNSAERCMGYTIRPVQGTAKTVAEAKVRVEGTEFDFGEVKVGETGTIQVTVTNTGDAELRYYVSLPAIVHDSDNFSENITVSGNAPGAYVSHRLDPGTSDTFLLLYSPQAPGVEEYSKFVVYTNAINGNKRITVRGKCPGTGSSNEDVGYGDWDF